MDLNTFLDHSDTIAEAPGGIAKLKALILDLAVRGKLVLHNPDDEPADKLLKEIQELKEALYSDKKASKKKDFLPLNCAEVPFAIPKAWKWVRLHQLCWLITDGTHHTPTYVDSGVPFLSVKDLSAGYLDFSNTRFITGEAHQELCARCKPEYGDILLTKVGTTGIAVEIDTRQEFSIFVSVALLKHFLEFTCPRFMRHLLNSPLVKQQSEDGTEGIGNKNLVLRKIYNFIVPLPPLAEQKRIVEKVNELMALCDRLAAAKQTRDDLRQKLRGSAIAALMNAETEEALEKSWAIVRDNWHSLSQDPKDIDELRRSVLQMAVRGKLEPQKSADKPSSKLVEEIQSQKRQLIQEKRIPKAKSLELIEKSETSYEIPCNWSWVRLGEISKVVEYGTSERASEVRDDVPVFRMNNIQNGKLSFNNLKYVSASIKDLPKLYLQDGDILFNRTNSYELVGKTGLFRGQSNHYTFASYLIRIVLFAESINPEFINLVMNSK